MSALAGCNSAIEDEQHLEDTARNLNPQKDQPPTISVEILQESAGFALSAL
jgi:hypothetical protein